MLTIEAKKKSGRSWEPIEVPELLTERIEKLKSLAGTDSVVDIQTSGHRVFLCGNEAMVNIISKHFPTGNVIWTMADAYEMVQRDPVKMVITIQMFATKEQVKMFLPDPPAKEGWDHLKPVDKV